MEAIATMKSAAAMTHVTYPLERQQCKKAQQLKKGP